MSEYTADELRALDVRIAQGVLNYKWFTFRYYPDLGKSLMPGDICEGSHNYVPCDEDVKNCDGWMDCVPRFTTDPAAKWGLLQAMIDDGALVVLEQPIDESARADIRTRHGDSLTKRNAQMYAPTIEIALALAALKACQEPKGESHVRRAE